MTQTTPPNFGKCLFTSTEENIKKAQEILKAAGYSVADMLTVSTDYNRAIVHADFSTLSNITRCIPNAAIA